ncbi:MAG: hypothetical protein LBP34_02250 [Flavobacteriaceae bacterium]|jgi:hypothetical protein|nr:hypothetical protein [Flavobacteriaceae bacterium]
MKRIFLFSLIAFTQFAMAQKFNYEQKWKEIRQLSEKGEAKSLLPKINQIYSQAKKENNVPEIVTSLIYQSQIISRTQEDEGHDSYKLVIQNFEKEIISSTRETKPVLQSLLARIYQDYMNYTRWERRNITEVETLSDDISTWTPRQLVQKSLDLYKESVQDKEFLQREKSKNWKKLLETQEDLILYPTLYDILVTRYINALSHRDTDIAHWEETDISGEPVTIDKDQIIKDQIAGLLDFHRNDSDKSAFLNVKLKEIIVTADPDKPESISEQVVKLAQSYPDEKFSAYLYYFAAEKIRDSNKSQAFAICRNVTYTEKNSWSLNCKNLQEELQVASLIFSLDRVLLPDQNIPLTLGATNLDAVYYRIYEVNPGVYPDITEKNTILNNNEIYSLTNKKVVRKGILKLKHFDDFAAHSTLVKLDGLPQGNYLIEFANNPDFDKVKKGTKNLLGSSYFMVHDKTLVKLGSLSSYQLVNRKTGKVLADRNLQLFHRLWDTGKDSKVLSNPVSVKTDNNGIFKLPYLKNNNYNYVYLYNPESQSYIKLSIYMNEHDSYDNKTQETTSIFTDRAIYRPGQKVYFKAIVYTKYKNEAHIVKNQRVTLSLHNVNNEEVSSLELISNEYGSVFGEFILPQGGLTGEYYLKSDFGYDSYSFSVEEYKRPKFEVSMDELKGEYTLEKEVITTGKAISYSGVPVSEAKMVYRVERQEIFPFYRWYFPVYSSSPETIVQGESVTDGEGKFTVSFTARPKEPRKDNEYRTYTYTVYADITDINGETHSAETRVTIGDLPKKLTLQIPDTSTQKDFTQIVINSTNLNDVKEPSRGKLTLTELKSPARIILPDKINSVPDYQLYDESTFNQYFPHIPYSKEEQNPQFWKKGNSVAYDFDTERSDTVSLKSNLSKGYYLVEAFTLYGKDSIKTQKIVEILDDKTLKSTDNLFYSASASKPSYKVGEKIEINFFSDLKDATAVLHLKSAHKWIEHKEIPIKNGKGTYSLTANKEFLVDGLHVFSYLINENGHKQESFSIKIEDEPKDLKIITKVFRDKLTPGSKETWELTLSGKDKDKITAEVLAAMYDASLDQFRSNSYSFFPWAYYPPYENSYQIQITGYYSNSEIMYPYHEYLNYKTPQIVDLIDFDIHYGLLRYESRSLKSSVKYRDVARMVAESPSTMVSEEEKEIIGNALNDIATDSAEISDVGRHKGEDKESIEFSGIQARTNLQETAFFYPNLHTDENGNVKLTFTSPEALTKWKILLLAHTQDLYSGTAELYAQTQKDLMVVPNVPRFLRENDEITISTKINNVSAKKLSGNARLFLFNALTDQPVDADFKNTSALVPFQADAAKNTEVNWTIKVPENIQAVTYRIVAQAGDFSDGEESILPIVTNRMLVTETLPVSIKENQIKKYQFDKLINAKSGSLQNFNLSLGMTTNPVWLAVFSLPYLREYPYECSEQLFSRLYGNVLSTYILNSSPKIKKVFDNWNAQGINVSNLEKNQELKNILLEETPWIRDAENESERNKRIALFFDLNKMSQENTQAQNKLIRRQNSDGSFSWFDGGYSSNYITQHIIMGFGQLNRMLGDKSPDYLNDDLQNVIKEAIRYADKQTINYIKEQKKYKEKVDGKNLIHYYYVRSFWKDQYKLPFEISKYLGDINKNISDYFEKYDLQNKAMAAVVLNRYGYETSARTIIHNLKETSVETDEMGMYWKDNRPGWYWYQTPVESQAKIIEAFAEVTPEDIRSIEEMKVWLLKNRQTNSWNSTKATTDAVYALMNFGKDWSDAEKGVKIFMGDTPVYPSHDITAEQASGYIKKSWNAEQIKPEMGMITVEKTSPGVAWGGIYWQYFEDLDKITKADSNIKMQKQLFRKVNTDKGQQLQEITDNKLSKVGDLITVRLVIKVDRNMEYIHIKDMRASGFEPVNVLSQYKYQNGAGYYESTGDAATNFFFERLTKGTYVFEYDVRANNKGEFSNGITQLQSMYAPEMSAHSEGIRVKIK